MREAKRIQWVPTTYIFAEKLEINTNTFAQDL